MESVTQSLAGRVAIFNLLPFSLEEIKNTDFALPSFEDYIFKGFYPRIYDLNLDPTRWLKDYITTYVERAVRQLLNFGDLNTFRQFLEVCSGRIGQLVNFSDIGNIIGASYQTVKLWLSVLETSFIIYTLRPYHKNFNKRIVKTQKLYFYDTGLACALLNIRNTDVGTQSTFGGVKLLRAAGGDTPAPLPSCVPTRRLTKFPPPQFCRTASYKTLD